MRAYSAVLVDAMHGSDRTHEENIRDTVTSVKWRSAVSSDGSGSTGAFASELRGLLDVQVHPDVSNSDFAAQANVSASTLSAAVGGKVVPTASVLTAILTAAGLGPTESGPWLNKRDAAASRPPSTTMGEHDTVRALVATRLAQWDSAAPGDPDYRINTRLLTRDEVLVCFRSAQDGALSPRQLAFILASAVFWGHRYLRWLEVAGTTADAAEVLVDGIVSPFRRVRWRSAWLLQRFDEPLRSRAVDLISEIWELSISEEEMEILQPILKGIKTSSVEATLRSWTDPEIDQGYARRSMLNEFVFECAKPGARGRLQA